MLSQIRFKNWRSLRDVTIDNLTPITVLIGANSAGKSNIIDGLHFMQDAIIGDPDQAMGNRGWEGAVRTLNVLASEPIEIEIGYRMPTITSAVYYRIVRNIERSPESKRILSRYSEIVINASGHNILHTEDSVGAGGVEFGQATFIGQDGSPEKKGS